MGRAMASNLVKAGHEVTVWNRTPGKDVEGAKTAASPAEAARDAEVIWTVRRRHESRGERFVRAAGRV